MLHIKSIIPKTIDRIRLKEEKDEQFICKKTEKIIKKDIPDSEVSFYREGALCVVCPNQTIANELFLKQEEVKEKINNFFKQKLVNRLIIKVG